MPNKEIGLKQRRKTLKRVKVKRKTKRQTMFNYNHIYVYQYYDTLNFGCFRLKFSRLSNRIKACMRLGGATEKHFFTSLRTVCLNQSSEQISL